MVSVRCLFSCRLPEVLPAVPRFPILEYTPFRVLREVHAMKRLTHAARPGLLEDLSEHLQREEVWQRSVAMALRNREKSVMMVTLLVQIGVVETAKMNVVVFRTGLELIAAFRSLCNRSVVAMWEPVAETVVTSTSRALLRSTVLLFRNVSRKVERWF